MLFFLVFLYLFLISFDLLFSIECVGNLTGLGFYIGGGFGCWDCGSIGGCKGFSVILGVNSLL